jgi:hypothetical protein
LAKFNLDEKKEKPTKAKSIHGSGIKHSKLNEDFTEDF